MSTPAKFNEGQTARVTALKQPTRKISGSEGVARQPRIGDVAEVVAATLASEGAQVVTAELIEDGKIVWRAEFAADELELAS